MADPSWFEKMPERLQVFYGFTLDGPVILAVQRALSNNFNLNTGSGMDAPDCPACKGVTKVRNNGVEENCLLCDRTGKAIPDSLLDIITKRLPPRI